MFTLTEDAKARYSILLPALVVLMLLVFAITGSAQTKVVSKDTTTDAKLVQILKMKLEQASVISQINQFQKQELEPAMDKAIAADTVLKQKQEMLTKASEELKKMQEAYTAAKESLESETGCILKEDTMSLDCSEEK